MTNKHTNKLIDQTSPYLLQHAHNPVDWYPWGDEALLLAKETDKPILVSIGYSACHWCHVMEKESFENEAVAEIMNDLFINIKIDREERPDLDAIYMDAVQTLTGSGGWPLNVFLTPDAKPFYGGTYFPPENAYKKNSWKDVLLSISAAWNEKRAEIDIQAEQITAHLRKLNAQHQMAGDSLAMNLDDKTCDEIAQNLMKTADKKWGGFGKAPKFPQTFSIQYLLQHYHFYKDEDLLEQALLSINKILQGGIYDHVGGGIARYSTDNEWLAPHFEKMLYDNALLISVLCDAFQITHSAGYEKTIRHMISFIEREMISNEGGFFSAIDADSEGEEGRFYVWQKTEIDQILGSDSILFCKFFDVTDAGNWEEKNILRILKPLNEFVLENNLVKEDFEKLMDDNLNKLWSHRNKRIKPSMDDKIILSWNALLLHAISKSATIFADDSLKELAIKNYQFIKSHFTKNSNAPELYHTYKNGIAKQDAFIDDYAYFSQACLSLYELTFDEKYLFEAKKYIEFIIENFGDEAGTYFYYTKQGAKDLIIRKIEMYDGAIPSANAIVAGLLQKFSIIFENISWRTRSEKMVTNYAPIIIKYPGSFGIWASLLSQQINGLDEITVIGSAYSYVGKEISLRYFPAKILICSSGNNSGIPNINNKNISAETQIFLCKKDRCLAPFHSIESFFSAI
jgi:uncharacterized protein